MYVFKKKEGKEIRDRMKAKRTPVQLAILSVAKVQRLVSLFTFKLCLAGCQTFKDREKGRTHIGQLKDT